MEVDCPPLFSVRPEWESDGCGAGAGYSVFARDLVAEAGVPSYVVVLAVPVGQLQACVQQARERDGVQQLVALACVR